MINMGNDCNIPEGHELTHLLVCGRDTLLAGSWPDLLALDLDNRVNVFGQRRKIATKPLLGMKFSPSRPAVAEKVADLP